MTIHEASFVMSNSDVAGCPKQNLPEYAFIGRSNVGKSSLINMLTNHKRLAKTSGKPGKTQLINHFLINSSWFLVDLPGYGYAKVSKTQKKIFQKYITNYFRNRKQLLSAFVLIDSRHPPQKIDLEFMRWLGENQLPFTIIFTKADKLNASQIASNIALYCNTLLDYWTEVPPYFVSSAVTKQGQNEILDYITKINLEVRHK